MPCKNVQISFSLSLSTFQQYQRRSSKEMPRVSLAVQLASGFLKGLRFGPERILQTVVGRQQFLELKAVSISKQAT